MSNGSNYKNCQDICLEDCSITGVSVFPTFMPIDGDHFCKTFGITIYDLFEKLRFEFATSYEKYMGKLDNNDIPVDLKLGKSCKYYLENYVAIVSIDTPRWFSIEICKYKPGYKLHDLL